MREPVQAQAVRLRLRVFTSSWQSREKVTRGSTDATVHAPRLSADRRPGTATRGSLLYAYAYAAVQTARAKEP